MWQTPVHLINEARIRSARLQRASRRLEWTPESGRTENSSHGRDSGFRVCDYRNECVGLQETSRGSNRRNFNRDDRRKDAEASAEPAFH